MKSLTKYRLLRPIILGFMTPRDQFDVLIEPEEGVTLESDGTTIWLINDKGRHESITMTTVLRMDCVEEISSPIPGGLDDG